MNKYRELLRKFDVSSVSIIENAAGIEFRPEFHLGNTLTVEQTKVAKETLRWALDTNKAPAVHWISLASREIVIGFDSSILVIESDGTSTFFDFAIETLVTVNQFESWKQPCLELIIQPEQGKDTDVVWKRILHFHGSGGHKIRASVLQELRPANRVVVAVFGSPGVGKSTLVNTILEEEKALVTTGKAGTTQSTWFETKDRKWVLVDTEGWNGKESTSDALTRLSAEIEFCRKGGTGFSFDVIWYCVSHRMGKLMKGEEELIRDIQNIHGVRVFIVSLLSPPEVDPSDDFVKAILRRRGKQLQTFFINAKELRRGNLILPSHGVNNLLDASRNVRG